MKKYKQKTLWVMLILIPIVSACNLMTFFGGNVEDPPDNNSVIFTQAAMTLQAMTEEVVLPPTSTTISSNDEIIITPIPSATTVPTITVIPTNTPLPTPVPPPCDQAYFNADVTIPDETVLPPGSHFTKIWQLKNIGTCTWTTDYRLMFMGGDKMNGNTYVSLPYIVRPGESLDISVNLIAPVQPGEYLGSWKLRNANGVPFGLGEDADVAFWVQIEVIDPDEFGVYNLASIFCDADWKNSEGNLLCAGSPLSGNGRIKYETSLKLENGTVENEPALWIYVNKNNYVVGEFPSFTVESGDRFISLVGCVYTFESCNVEFRLDYQIEGDSAIYNLGEWDEEYDGNVTHINIDLSTLAGNNVEFRLVTIGNDDSVENHVFWLNPHIKR